MTKMAHNLICDKKKCFEMCKKEKYIKENSVGFMCMWRLVLLYFNITGQKII